MTLRPVMIERFPGLDMRQDPGDSRGALVASHVVLDGGTVRARDGFAEAYAGTASEIVLFLHNRADDSLFGDGQYILAVDTGASGKFYAMENTGAITSVAHVALSSYSATAVTIGTSSATYTYMTDVSGTGPVRRWDGAAFSAPAGMPTDIGVLTYMPVDNRMVACTVSDSRVWFSGAGTPETWGANDYVYLTPNDGESITGAAVFDNKLFIFKSSKYFVFYGNSTSATGTPIFNYRSVDTGIGMDIGSGYAVPAVAAGPRALYFQGPDGIYATTGGPPVKISAPLDPFFTVPASTQVNPYWNVRWNGTGPMVVHRDTLYVQIAYFIVGSGTSHRGILVYDIASQSWSIWPDYAPTSVFASGMMAWNDLLWLGVDNDVTVQVAGTATDSIQGVATAFTASYRLPFENYGTPLRKRVREVIVEGYGTPRLYWSRDWGAADTVNATVTLGTAPAIATGRRRYAIRGREFSLQFQTGSGLWKVNRAQVNISDAFSSAEVAR